MKWPCLLVSVLAPTVNNYEQTNKQNLTQQKYNKYNNAVTLKNSTTPWDQTKGSGIWKDCVI
jgi:hypothetical protein